jgi:hypothetical protein
MQVRTKWVGLVGWGKVLSQPNPLASKPRKSDLPANVQTQTCACRKKTV